MPGDDEGMTIAGLDAGALAHAGLPAADVADWAAAAPGREDSFAPAAAAVSTFAARSRSLLQRLPAAGPSTEAELAAREAITGAVNSARSRFLHAHTAALYAALTSGCTRPLRPCGQPRPQKPAAPERRG